MNLSFLEPNASYVMKNHLLLVPAEWMLHEELSKSIEESKPKIKDFIEDMNFRNQASPDDFPIWRLAKREFDDVYTIPLFSDMFCKVMIDEIQNIKSQGRFKVNSEEEKDVQIEEFVLKHNSPGWYTCMLQLIYAKFNIIYATLFNRIVAGGTIQLANYNPKEISQTAWHHDGENDITMVVPLNTGDYEGGGTEFWNKGVVDPLPNGHALIFPTYSNLHRGLPLTKGDRYLFVFWLKSAPQKEDA